MKKTLLFIILCLLVGVTASAKVKPKPKAAAATYTVEKAHNVHSNGAEVTEQSTLTDKSVIEIENNGYIMFVNQKAKKRYYISKPQKGTVKNLIAIVKAPMMSEKQSRSRDTYSSAGYVTMRPPAVYLDNVEADKNGDIKVYMIEEDE